MLAVITIRRIAVALAVTALLVPAAASARIVYDQPQTVQPAQDLRSPDARDAAEGRYLGQTSPLADTTSPPVRPAPAPVETGVDWPSAGIGAALFGGLVLAGFGIATVRRVRPRPVS
jgi:hypothetical protein